MFFFMPGSLKDVVPAVERMTRTPGRILIRNAAVVNGLLLVLSLILARGGVSTGVIVVIGFAVLGIAATAIFGWRRERLQAAVEKWRHDTAATIDGDVTAGGADYSEYYRGSTPSASSAIMLSEDGTIDESRSGAGRQPDPARSAQQDPSRARQAAEEARIRKDTWMPAVEAAQRSAIAAAGGLANAPYLRDDLRITIATAMATFVSIPVSLFLGFWVLIAIL